MERERKEKEEAERRQKEEEEERRQKEEEEEAARLSNKKEVKLYLLLSLKDYKHVFMVCIIKMTLRLLEIFIISF